MALSESYHKTDIFPPLLHCLTPSTLSSIIGNKENEKISKKFKKM